MRISYRQNAFNAGELSPRLKGRTDLDKYQTGLQTCQNAIVLPGGGVTKRPGFRYINSCKNANKYAELIPFEFSEEQAYALEFGDEYMRVYMDGGRVTTADANTLLLLHGDGEDRSIVITDNGVTPHIVSAYGNAQIDTAQYVFPTGSILFDGTGDYLSIPDHANWNFGATAFTIDLRVRFYANSGISVIWCQKDATGGDHILLFVDHEEGKIHFQVTNTGADVVNESATWAPSVDTWYHVALIRGWGGGANAWAICVEGATVHTFTDAGVMPDHDQVAMIGGNLGSNYVLDYTARHPAWTLGSAPVIDSGASKFGDAAWRFDGTDDYLVCADHADWDVIAQANFTIDLWVKHADHGATDAYLAHSTDVANYWWLGHLHGTGLVFQVQVGGGGEELNISGGEITDTNWHHVAVCKVGNNYGVYKDGVQVAYGSYAGADAFAGNLYIGTWAAGQYFGGYLDDIRITHDNAFTAAPVVGLTNTITMPTKPHSTSTNAKLVLRGDQYDLYGWLDEFRVSNVARWTVTAFDVPVQEYPAGGGGITYELATPWDHEDVFGLRVVQSTDTLYVFHPNYPTYKITRVDHDNWTLTEVDWAEPPWNDLNTTAITLDPDATAIGAGVGIVSSAPFFSDAHVGAYFKLKNGFIKITAVTNSTTAVCTIKATLDDHVATTDWYQGAWDATQSYPSMGVFYEDRLVVIEATHPLTVFLSETGNYENFGEMSSPIVDTDPVQADIMARTQNQIQWIEAGKKLFIGTVGGEFWMTGETIDLPITPTSILVRRETTFGGDNLQPITIGHYLFFAQKGSKRIREWGYSNDEDAYMGSDLNILSEHMTKDFTIEKIQYAQDPNGIIWMPLSNGYMMGMTYLREHKVVGFHMHDTGMDGVIESVCVIPGTYGDEVWAIICRDLGGTDVRYVERMEPDFFGGALVAGDAFFVDSGLEYTGAPAVAFAGIDHLEGETIQVLADGVYIGTKVVASGGFTITNAASSVIAGLGYNMNLKTLIPDIAIKEGSNSNRLKRIVDVTYQVYETCDFKFGRDSSNLLTVGLTDGVVSTGEYLRPFNGEHALYPSIYVRQDEPTPFTLLSLTYELEQEDD